MKSKRSHITRGATAVLLIVTGIAAFSLPASAHHGTWATTRYANNSVKITSSQGANTLISHVSNDTSEEVQTNICQSSSGNCTVSLTPPQPSSSGDLLTQGHCGKAGSHLYRSSTTTAVPVCFSAGLHNSFSQFSG